MNYQWLRSHRSIAPAVLEDKPDPPGKKPAFKLRVLGACMLMAMSGCTLSTTRYGWPGSYAPAGIPNAQDCVPIHFGQPTDFACPGGKVYTAQQLKSLRQEKTDSRVASAGY